MLFPPRASHRPLPAVTPWDVVLVLLLFATAAVVLGGLKGQLSSLFGPELSQDGLFPLLFFQAAIPILLIYLLVLRRRQITWSDIGLQSAHRAWYRLAIVGGLLCVPLVALSRLLFEPLMDGPFQNPQIEVLGGGGFSWTNLIAMLFLVGFLIPLMEEMIFRGLLFPLLRRYLRFSLAAILSALCFAAMHLIPPLIPAFVIMGLILAFAREHSGSLWPPIIIHGLFNSLNIVALYATLAMTQAG